MNRFLVFGLAGAAFPLAALAQISPAPPAPPSIPAQVSGTQGGDSSTEASGSVGMSKLSLQDTHFIKVAALGGMAEVSDGKLAANSGDDTVRNIGNTMVTDHTKVNAQLLSIAKEKGVTPPVQIDAQHMAISARLKALSGAAFDRDYLRTQLKAHDQAIDAFKAEASTGSDPDLKSFATATLPTLQMHLSMIQAAMK